MTATPHPLGIQRVCISNRRPPIQTTSYAGVEDAAILSKGRRKNWKELAGLRGGTRDRPAVQPVTAACALHHIWIAKIQAESISQSPRGRNPQDGRRARPEAINKGLYSQTFTSLLPKSPRRSSRSPCTP